MERSWDVRAAGLRFQARAYVSFFFEEGPKGPGTVLSIALRLPARLGAGVAEEALRIVGRLLGERYRPTGKLCLLECETGH